MTSIDDSNRLNAATFAAQATLYSGHRPGYPAELVAHAGAPGAGT